MGTGPQVVALEPVKAGAGEAQFAGRVGGGEVAAAMAGHEVVDEGSGETVDQLQHFMAARLKGRQGFCASKLSSAEQPGGHVGDDSTCRWSGFRRRSGCVPAEPYLPLKQPKGLQVPDLETTDTTIIFLLIAHESLFLKVILPAP